MKKTKQIFLIQLFFFVCAINIFAQKNILFFGNSFTRYNNVTGTVANIADAGGFDKPNIGGRLADGNTLAQHITAMVNDGTSSVIYTGIGSSDNWDFVVEQEYSTKPTSIGDPSAFRADALSLFNLVKARSENVTAVMFETWARPNLCPPYGSTFINLEDMQLQLFTNYSLAVTNIVDTSSSRAILAPVGNGFELAGFPLSIYASDKYHAGPKGSLLEAMIIYASIYGNTLSSIPKNNLSVLLAEAGVSLNDWEYAAPIADKTVFGSIDPFYDYTIDIDFGVSDFLTTNSEWNNITNPNLGTELSNLFSNNGSASSVSLFIESNFLTNKACGITADALFPESAQRDGFVIASGQTSTLYFSNLKNYERCALRVFGSFSVEDPNYNLSVFDTQNNSVIDTMNNVSKQITFSELTVNSNGEAYIFFNRPGTNSDDKTIVSAIELSESDPTAVADFQESLLFDFGDSSYITPGNWNNAVNPFPDQIINCINSNGSSTDISLVMSNWYGGSNQGGTTTPDPLFGLPATATRDNAFGGTDWVNSPTSYIYLTNLKLTNVYSFTFFASRTGVSDNRETLYTVEGAPGSSDSVVLNPSNNSSNDVITKAISPDSDGKILITLTWGSNNNQTPQHFWYLGYMKIDCYSQTKKSKVCQCDFGVPEFLSSGNWNNITNYINGYDFVSLVDSNGLDSGFKLQISKSFSYADNKGVATNLLYSLNAQRDGFILDKSDTNAALIIKGLSVSNVYLLNIFGSYIYDVNKNMMVVAGDENVVLNTENNIYNSVIITNLVPSNGILKIDFISQGTNDTDNSCLNTARLGVSVPEPSFVFLSLVFLIYKFICVRFYS